MVHHRGWLGWHREKALFSPTVPSDATSFLLGGCCCRNCFLSERRSLGWYYHPMQAGGFIPSAGPSFSEIWPQVDVSFSTTTSYLLPQDDLVGTCH